MFSISDYWLVGHQEPEAVQQAVEGENGGSLQEITSPHCQAANFTSTILFSLHKFLHE